MSDLNGRSWISTQNRVEESLGRLQKFIRPMADETGRGTDLRRRKNELSTTIRRRTKMTLTGMPFCKGLDEHLWGRITQDLSLPESVPYDDSGDEYPVTYGFGLDGTDFETTVDADGGLDVTIEVHGVRPDHTLPRAMLRRRSTGRLTRTGWMTSESISSNGGHSVTRSRHTTHRLLSNSTSTDEPTLSGASSSVRCRVGRTQ